MNDLVELTYPDGTKKFSIVQGAWQGGGFLVYRPYEPTGIGNGHFGVSEGDLADMGVEFEVLVDKGLADFDYEQYEKKPVLPLK